MLDASEGGRARTKQRVIMIRATTRPLVASTRSQARAQTTEHALRSCASGACSTAALAPRPFRLL